MLTRRMKLQLVAFVVLGLVATSYLGARYVGIDPFNRGYEVAVTLPEAGGLFDNGEVTFRGVPVGRIDSLEATDEGTTAVLRIDADAPVIPSDVEPAVANRSAIGEQYLDLRGGGTGEPLADGVELDGMQAQMPQPIEQVLRSGRDFSASVPQDALTTVIDEGYEASRGAGQDLGRLLDTSRDLVKTADRGFLNTQRLVETADRVLTTQQESATSITSFSTDLRDFSATLADSDRDLRSLIAAAPGAAEQTDQLVRQVGGPLGTLFDRLVAPVKAFGENGAGMRDALIRLPEAVSVTWAVTGSQGLDLGLAQTYTNPVPCTSGYDGTPVRGGLDTTTGKPFNTQAGCTASPSTGTGVRGPQAIPDSWGRVREGRR
ncbi:MlaD family protein [Aeromicrobium sp. IC_218]|uniref:MlaD family protein n=1 Tax=Aeromicrobium sp. IC_218 TaxID=2545468 RepID=UPI00103F56C4|nr:MlaD family protein [Aeromicrobium sp. IC_218]TCI97566.1 MCE family protein [Aeromicrobium sp. IC_218]